MQINWFTVVAQILNFLVLIWLMKRYLYKPILDAIDEREKKIADELADAKTKQDKAIAEQDEFNKKNQVFDQEKKALMDKATAEAGVQSQKLLDEAKINAKALQDKLEKAAREHQAELSSEMALKAEQNIFSITRKVLADLADVPFEEQSVGLFTRRITEIKDPEKEQLIKALDSGPDPILVQSAFELTEKQQGAIESALSKITGRQPSFEFKTSAAIIGGIELTTKGYKLSWSISAYINSLEKSIAEIKIETPAA